VPNSARTSQESIESIDEKGRGDRKRKKPRYLKKKGGGEMEEKKGDRRQGSQRERSEKLAQGALIARRSGPKGQKSKTDENLVEKRGPGAKRKNPRWRKI